MTDPAPTEPSPTDPAPRDAASGGGGDDPAFLARVDRYLHPPDLTGATDEPTTAGPDGAAADGAVPTAAIAVEDAAVVADLERELAADPAKRRAFVLACLGESLVGEELAIAAAAAGAAGDRSATIGLPTADDLAAVESGGPARGLDDWPAAATLHDTMVLPALRPGDAGGSGGGDDEPARRLPPFPFPRPAAAGRHRRAWAAAAVAAAAAVVAVAVWPRGEPVRPASAPPSTNGTAVATAGPAGGPAPEVPAPARPPAAVIAAAFGATWEGGGPAAAGTELPAGATLALATGTAELRMVDAAGTDGVARPGAAGPTDVVVEAPARLRIDSSRRVALTYGKVVVRMADGDAGFVVDTPAAAVTDLGTEFGVAAGPPDIAGGAPGGTGGGPAGTDVHVFRGRVRVAPARAAVATTPARTAAPSSSTTSPAGTATVVAAGPTDVVAGDAARVSAGGGPVAVDRGGVRPQWFVRAVGRVPAAPLSLVDLASGGDGTTGRRDGVIDPLTGASGRSAELSPEAVLTGDGAFHRVPALPVVDGCFIPVARDGRPTRVDSAGHAFAFAGSLGKSTVRVAAGGRFPRFRNGSIILTEMGGVDYADPSRSYLFLHPDMGITFDLAAVRRLHPGVQVVRFRCAVGNSIGPGGSPASAVVLVDGVERFARRGFGPADGPAAVDVPLADADRMLTLATTGDGNPMTDQILFGDPVLDVAPAATPSMTPAR